MFQQNEERHHNCFNITSNFLTVHSKSKIQRIYSEVSRITFSCYNIDKVET